jgi:hypothetical protein
LNHISCPFCSGYFRDDLVSSFPGLASNHNPLNLRLLILARNTGGSHLLPVSGYLSTWLVRVSCILCHPNPATEKSVMWQASSRAWLLLNWRRKSSPMTTWPHGKDAHSRSHAKYVLCSSSLIK